MNRHLTLDIGDLSDGCTDHALEFLHKAISDPPDSQGIWTMHPDKLLAEAIETFSQYGMYYLEGIHQSIRGLLKALFDVRKARMLLDAKAVRHAIRSLQNRPVQEWTADDWMAVIDWLVLNYLPNGVIRNSAEYLAVRAIIAARIKEQMPGAKPGAKFAELVPETMAELRRRGLLRPTQELLGEIAITHAAESITNIGEQVKHRLKTLVLNHLSERVAGAPPALKRLEESLFDEFSILNRDWRRVAITEAGEVQTQTMIASLEVGAIVKRYEAYEGACDFCHKIDGMEFTVVDPAKPDKDGWKEVWVGKTNLGRSASPRKRVGDELVEREPDERWWPAAGLQHPHCFVNPKVAVYTVRGARPIGSIKIGDEVLTHQGRFRKVIWVRDPELYVGRLFRFKCSNNGRNSEWTPWMTPEHPMLTNNGWKIAAAIIKSDGIFATAKGCVTCGNLFVSLKHKHVEHCSNKCSPKLGLNQFNTGDRLSQELARAKISEANSQRLKKLTIEEKRSLTEPARAVMRERGWGHLQTAENRKKLGISVARFNYMASPVELKIGHSLRDIGYPVEFQHRIPQVALDGRGRKKYWWIDIALPQQKIAVEIDGEPWHGRLSGGRDTARDADFATQGWQVLRFDSKRAEDAPQAIADEIARIAMNHDGDYQFALAQIECIESKQASPKSRLYNLGVDEDESFIVGKGFVAHNCRGGWNVVGHVAKDPKVVSFVDELMRKHGLVGPKPAVVTG